ncbi:MAG TPA: GNAT family N-acetyltransferase [Firmicutes bacterium]|nr:GNAT family N-acetyltransferase [Bacillota bacterium]
MTFNELKRPPDPFGDDEGILDIQCRPALPKDHEQIALLAAGLLDRVFGDSIGHHGSQVHEAILHNLQMRLRNDCTWVMLEGETVIGMIDLETAETRRLNGVSIPRAVADSLGLLEKVEHAGLLPLLVHEPAPDEAHQPLVALLPGSRGEGRGTLLLMHGVFWAKAQGKNWMTAWIRMDDGYFPVYKRRGYYIEKEVEAHGDEKTEKWLLLKRPISSMGYKSLRDNK